MVANMKQESMSLVDRMGITAADLRARKEFIDFNDQDVRILRELQPLVREHSDAIADGFYHNIQRYDELLSIIKDAGSSIERLKSAQKTYLIELFSGDYGEAYVEQRLRIGVIHNKIGLTPRWYLGSYSVYMQLLMPLLYKKFRFSPNKLIKAIEAINKILTFDAQLAIDTYINALVEDYKSVTMSKDDIESRVASYRQFIEQVATGDLSRRLDVQGQDDLGQLGHQLNAMTESLGVMARQAGDASDLMSTRLDQMLGAVSDQSVGAAEQASAVSEATSSIEQIRAISIQTREKATALGQAAERTRNEGERGMETADQTVDGMEAIREKVEGIAENILALSQQTQQIGEITGTVNNLAQQLKMLALNASIEAAKAGEAGKGFAVVATEVKDLAEQSQQATEQVHKILQDIQHATDRAVMATEEGSKGVDQGMELVKQAGEAVRNLTEVIRETALASQQIVAAVSQEAAGIDQITVAMSEINKATAQFVTSTEQTKTAANEMGEMAIKMRHSVSAYKV